MNTNNKTLSNYGVVSTAIGSIGDKIAIKNNKVKFNDAETKDLEAVVDYDNKYKEYYIKYSKLPPIIIKGS